MEKLVSNEVLKLVQSLVLPLELKINSLIDMVRSLETKLDKIHPKQQSNKEGMSVSSMTPVLAIKQPNTTSKTTTSAAASEPAQPIEESKIVMTRRQRARVPVVAPPHPTTLSQRAVRYDSAECTAETCITLESTLPVSENDATKDVQQMNQWTTQQRRRRYRRPVIRGTGDSDSELASVERMRRIHVWSLRADVTPEKVQAYMMKRKPSDTAYDVQKLELKHQNYSSFVITVPESAFEYFMNGSSWPPNTEFNEWFQRRRKNSTANP